LLSEEKIAEIRDRTDIAALVGEYVRLTRSGASFKGLCPFHNEKSPSFYVTPSKQFFHCFGCGASGDVISFLMKLEGRPFPEAARQLAERGGIEIPEEDTHDVQEQRRARQKKERLGSLMGAATDFYVRMLTEHELSGMAQAELEKRGVTPEMARHFKLGYAPHSWDALASHLAHGDWSPAEAEEVGLIVPRRTRDGHYDRFRHRLMFPIADVHGTIVAFSGRLLATPSGEKEPAEGEAGAKYVNSPESPLYKKGETLFGLHEGRVAIRRQGLALVCEGNFDLVMLHQAGFENSVAPMGTALTLAQAKLLRRFAERVVCVFDGDNAGRKAVRAAFPVFREAGVSAKVVTLPKGDDPDTYLRARGVDAFRGLVDNAPGIVEHLIDDSADTAGADPQARAAAVAALGPLLGAIENEVERSLYVERVARRFAIGDVDLVRRTLRQGFLAARAAGGAGRGQASRAAGDERSGERGGRVESARTVDARTDTARADTAPVGSASPSAQRPPPQRKPPPLEGELVGILIDQPELFESDGANSLEELLTSPELRAILLAARDSTHRGKINAAAMLASVGTHPFRLWLEERLSLGKYEDGDSARRALAEGMPRLELAAMKLELDEAKQQVLQARRRGDDDGAMTLLRRVDELHAAIFATQGAKK